MTMKTFDPNKPVQTRDGRDARIVAVDRACSGETIVAAVRMASGEERLRTYNTDGQYFNDMEDTDDLANIPVKNTGWVIVKRYRHAVGVFTKLDRIFDSEQEAHDYVGKRSITDRNYRDLVYVAKVEWEE